MDDRNESAADGPGGNLRHVIREAEKALAMAQTLLANAQLWSEQIVSGKLAVEITPHSAALSWLFRKLVGSLPKCTVRIVPGTPAPQTIKDDHT